MTTPSTTALVNGTPDRMPTSSATSVDGEEDTSELNATRRHHLEQLAVPRIRNQHPWPSTASFNSSLDRMNDDADNVQSQQSVSREDRNWVRMLLAAQVDGVDGPSNDPSPRDNQLRETSPSHRRTSATREVVIHQEIIPDGYPDDANNVSTMASDPPSHQDNPTKEHQTTPPLRHPTLAPMIIAAAVVFSAGYVAGSTIHCLGT
ncbi:MAG: hypothetical protein Q9223_001513 [Gallowayella weberi]